MLAKSVFYQLCTVVDRLPRGLLPRWDTGHPFPTFWGVKAPVPETTLFQSIENGRSSHCKWIARRLIRQWSSAVHSLAGFGSALLIRDAQGRAKLPVLTGAKDDFSGPSMLTIVKRNGKRYAFNLAIQHLELN